MSQVLTDLTDDELNPFTRCRAVPSFCGVTVSDDIAFFYFTLFDARLTAGGKCDDRGHTPTRGSQVDLNTPLPATFTKVKAAAGHLAMPDFRGEVAIGVRSHIGLFRQPFVKLSVFGAFGGNDALPLW
ncbi:hypothetical protein [Mycolicibacterium sp. CBMA 213]|uniref:hypothetical protein n=1 Tax=Mycolicibacterium sp. CBMA 213 TaxID=1968788 RepID=UPI0012DF0B9E|nr:hypothetical protein [Mycolicibacterium sp. CBMA 213]